MDVLEYKNKETGPRKFLGDRWSAQKKIHGDKYTNQWKEKRIKNWNKNLEKQYKEDEKLKKIFNKNERIR